MPIISVALLAARRPSLITALCCLVPPAACSLRREADAAQEIEAAVLSAVREKKTTSDIGGTLGTREAGEWVAQRVSRR